MNYIELMESIKKSPVCLVPIGVIEEHGPHMPLGTDSYLSYNLCIKMKDVLEKNSIPTLISPVIKWGINTATGGFTGSFNIREETFINLCTDILSSLIRWGLKNIYLVNVHGDMDHVRAILRAVKSLSNEDVNIKYLVPDFFKERDKLTEDEKSNLLMEETEVYVRKDSYMDVHAGGIETGIMRDTYPHLVNTTLAFELIPSNTTYDMWKTWLKGGSKSKEITPMGYLGSPGDINEAAVENYIKYTHINLANLIIKELKEKI